MDLLLHLLPSTKDKRRGCCYSKTRPEGGESAGEVNEVVVEFQKSFRYLEIEKEFDACFDQIGI
jgi:hypothetical protein